MGSLIYLDTPVVARLYGQGPDALPAGVAARLEASDDIRISPMVRLELQFLSETGRVGLPPLPVVDELASALGLSICRAAFAAVAREAESHQWTYDPFDRLIVAQASLFDAPLVTRDENIRAHYAKATWG